MTAPRTLPDIARLQAYAERRMEAAATPLHRSMWSGWLAWILIARYDHAGFPDNDTLYDINDRGARHRALRLQGRIGNPCGEIALPPD